MKYLYPARIWRFYLMINFACWGGFIYFVR